MKASQYGTAPLGAWASLLLVLLIIGGIFVVGIGFAFITSNRDDGISLHGDALHSCRAAGDTHEVSTHTSPPR